MGKIKDVYIDTFNKGLEAYYLLEPVDANPYPENTPEHDGWFAGWCEGEHREYPLLEEW